MKTKYKILIAVLIIVIAGGIYGYREYTRGHADLSEQKADFTVDATSLITAFEKDSASASKQYIDKVVLVQGRIKSIDTSGVLTIGSTEQMSSVQCTMDKRHPIDYASLKEGTSVAIQGKCSGYETQDLLGTDVKMNFCVLKTNK